MTCPKTLVEETSRCSRCRVVKPATDFARNRSRPCGLQFWCRSCDQAQRQARTPRLPRFPVTPLDATLAQRRRVFAGDAALARAYYRARAAGSLTPYAADRLATHLGLHPAAVWRDWAAPSLD